MPTDRRSRNPIDTDTDEEMRRARSSDPDDEDDEDDDGVGDDGDPDDDGGDDDDADEALEALGLGQVVIGDPFALTGEVALVEATAVVAHEDGRKFRIDLLREKPSKSPHTGQRYTHLLVIAPTDDSNIIAETVREVLANNGITGEQLEAVARGAGGGDVAEAEEDDDER